MARIIVTGGNSGMGKEAVKAFLAQGDQVVFTSRSTEASEAMLVELNEYTQQGVLHFCRCDSSSAADVDALAQFAKQAMGGCDVLVNSAAIFIGGEIHEMAESDYDLEMQINMKGIFLTCKHIIPLMLAQGNGSIINISSLCGKRGGYNCAVYAASKAAVNNFTRSIGLDYMSRGIRANAICPSATATQMFITGSTPEVIRSFEQNNPSERISTPEEIADLILFLASDRARFINAECISIDGGLSGWNAEPRQNKTERLD